MGVQRGVRGVRGVSCWGAGLTGKRESREEEAMGGLIRPAPKIDWRAAACAHPFGPITAAITVLLYMIAALSRTCPGPCPSNKSGRTSPDGAQARGWSNS